MSKRRRSPSSGGARKASVNVALDGLYAQVPDVECKGFCQDSCGSVAMTELEQRRIAERHNVRLPLVAAPSLTPVVSPLGVVNDLCTAIDGDGRCGVYADRPMVCRLWGAVEEMPCRWGCVPAGGRMRTGEGHRLLITVQRLSQSTER